MKIKAMISGVLAAALAVSLAGCGAAQGTAGTGDVVSKAEETAEIAASETAASEAEASEAENTASDTSCAMVP